MSKPSGYLQKLQNQGTFLASANSVALKQFLFDVVCVTLHETDGFGYERLLRVMTAMEENYEKYQGALTPSTDPEADFKRAKLDAVLHEIVGTKGPQLSFEERYPELRQITYDGRTKPAHRKKRK